MASFAATVSALFSKIIAFFMSIFMLLFPSSATEMQQRQENSLDIWTPIIEEAIVNKDVAATMDFMCEALRQEPDVPDKIQAIYDLINGTVIKIEWSRGFTYDNQGVSGSDYDLLLTTTSDMKYKLTISWMLVDVDRPDLTKCNIFTLSAIQSDNTTSKALYGFSCDKYSSHSEPAWLTNFINAIQTKNVAAVEEAMCSNIKKNNNQLTEQIQQFFNLMKGDIVSIEPHQLIDVVIIPDETLQSEYIIFIRTTEDIYVLRVDWQEMNNTDPEAYNGMNGLFLGISTPNGRESLLYITSDHFVEQRNIEEWLSE